MAFVDPLAKGLASIIDRITGFRAPILNNSSTPYGPLPNGQNLDGSSVTDNSYLYQQFMKDAQALQEQNQAAQAEQNRLEREFQAQSAADADRRWKENLQASTDAQRMLRQTQYQDYVDSLRAAGLNPMLAVMNGVPSTPSVHSASHAASGGNSNVGIDTDSVSDYYNTLVSSAFDLTKGIANTIGNVLGSSAKYSFLGKLWK